MTREIELAKNKLFSKDEFDAADFKAFAGDDRYVKPSDMANEIYKSLVEIEAGNFTFDCRED